MAAGKNCRRWGPGASQPKSDGPIRNPRHHFPDDLGLAGLPGDPANQPAHEQDDGKLQEEGGSQLRVVMMGADPAPENN